MDLLCSLNLEYLLSVAMDSVASRLVSAERNAFQLEETKVLLPWFYIPSY